jgi:hypothetical protein
LLHARAPQWAGVTLLALASALPGLAAFLAGDSGAAGALTHHDKLFGSAVMLIVATTSGASHAPPPHACISCDTRAAQRLQADARARRDAVCRLGGCPD